ncbi:MAG: arabinose efflux permease family protein [Firmicutes bacterium]|nr:arabinose efflux permease family protein [Bacillota bacterium]
MSLLSHKFSESLSILQNKDLKVFLFARIATALAYQMLTVGVGWKIYDLTDSAFYLGLVGLMQFLPMVLLTLLVGHVVDRYDRRMIMRLCQGVEAAGVLLLAVGCYTNYLTKESILLIVFIIGAARAFEVPSMQALLPGLVDPEIFPRAIALASSSQQTATIIGPALGGILYIHGSTTVFAIVCTLYMLSSLFISFIQSNPLVPKREPVNIKSLFAGIIFIRSKTVILGAISLDLFAVLLGGATALLPVYAKEILIIGPVGLGIFRSSPAVGALIMSIFLAHNPLTRGVGRKMFMAVIIFGVATITFALSTSLVISIAALTVLGAADTISVVIRSSLVQLQTPDEMRGRVSAVNSLFIGTSNQLGEFESGLLAAYLGVVPSVVLGGIGTIMIALVWMRIFSDLANIKTLETCQK